MGSTIPTVGSLKGIKYWMSVSLAPACVHKLYVVLRSGLTHLNLPIQNKKSHISVNSGDIQRLTTMEADLEDEDPEDHEKPLH
jgi:hypothetical protein